MSVAITPRDRLSFALFLALSVHAALILGVGFVWQAHRAHTPTIEVTLAQHDDKTAPSKADFIAQANQQGSGDAAQARELTTTQEAAFHDNALREVHQEQITYRDQRDAADPFASMTTRATSREQASTTPSREATPAEPTPQSRPQLDLSRDIASLEARIDEEQQQNARGPRIRRLDSVSARATADAYYLESWSRKVEALGNLNYPEEARRDHLYGSLVLLVAIGADGSLKDVHVIESSGKPVLDDAAVRIVKLSAPFAPPPPAMLAGADIVEITRTWQFVSNRYSSY